MNYLRRSRTPAAAAPPRTGWRTAVDRLATALLPQACALCGRFAGRWPVCAGCDRTLPRPPERTCPRCGDTAESGDACARCLAAPPAFDAAVAAFAYAPPIDGLIHDLKYGHRLHLAAWFGDALAHRCAAAGAVAAADAWTVAMPLHPDRLVERGFNQAGEIARAVARRLGAPLRHDLVRRVRATPPQATLALADRHANIRHAFESDARLGGRPLVLVDDVMTSGASLNELARTLRLAGAGRIVVAVAARTLHA